MRIPTVFAGFRKFRKCFSETEKILRSPFRKTTESLSLYSLHSDHCVLAVDIPFLRYAVFRTACQFISQNLAADGFFVLLCDLGQLIVAVDGYADVIGHFEAALLTHGLDLADDLVYEASSGVRLVSRTTVIRLSS